MIADLDDTIRQLMIDELPIKNGEIDISFHQPRREWSARLSRPAFNCFLYDIRENAQLRAHAWDAAPANGRTTNGAKTNGAEAQNLAHRRRTPLRVDCTYVITAWAFDPGDEHRLLSRCMLALFRFPFLPEERLHPRLRTQPYELRTRLASQETLTNVAELWGALDNEARPSLTYIVTLAIDPWETITDPMVINLTLRAHQTNPTPASSAPIQLQEDKAQGTPNNTIAGTVRNRTGDGAPPDANLEV